MSKALESLQTQNLRQSSFFESVLKDALNRAQTNSWHEYVGVSNQVISPEEPDTGIAPRGLSDDEELRRLGEIEGAEELANLLRGNGGPDYGG